MPTQDFDRFRSFAERYIIARAGSFRAGFEREDAWQTTLDAKTIYGNVARMSIDAEPLELEVAKLAGNMTGNVGPMGPPGQTRCASPKQSSVGPVAPHKEATTPPWLKVIIDKIRVKEGLHGAPQRRSK